MKYSPIIIAIAILAASCKTPSPQLRNPTCTELWRVVKACWRYDPDKRIYKATCEAQKLEFELVRNQDCVKTLSKRELHRIFGKPSKVEGNDWYYYLSETCAQNGPKAYGCGSCKATFDSEGNVTAWDYGHPDVPMQGNPK